MNTITANEFKKSTGRAMDQAQRQPITVEKYGRPYVVILSHEDYRDYERLRYAALKAGIQKGIESCDGSPFDPDALIAEIGRGLTLEAKR